MYEFITIQYNRIADYNIIVGISLLLFNLKSDLKAVYIIIECYRFFRQLTVSLCNV